MEPAGSVFMPFYELKLMLVSISEYVLNLGNMFEPGEGLSALPAVFLDKPLSLRKNEDKFYPGYKSGNLFSLTSVQAA